MKISLPESEKSPYREVKNSLPCGCKFILPRTTIGIQELAYQRVSTMSGGQKQRVAIARAIVNNPRVLLADEPTGALDSMTADEIMTVFKMLNAEGKTVVIVTHDIEIARQCDRIF